MTETGVRDPEDPDRWLVVPWPAAANFDAVLQHFQLASIARLPTDGSIARVLAFHQGLRVALAAAPTENVTNQDQLDWCRYLLDCAELSVTLLEDQYLAHYGHDPQTVEDQHVQAVKQQRTQPPEP